MEKKKLPFSNAPKDDRNLADIHLGLYESVIVFDHVEKVFFFFFLFTNIPSSLVFLTRQFLNHLEKNSIQMLHKQNVIFFSFYFFDWMFFH